MGFRDEFYPQTVALMITRYGESAPDGAGNRLPLTSPVNAIGVLGMLSPHVIRVLEEFQRRAKVSRVGGMFVGAVPEEFVDENGLVAQSELAFAASRILPWRDYVAGIPKPGNPTARTTVARAGEYNVPWLPDIMFGDFAETDLLGFLRQMMFDWQAAVDATAEGIRSQANAATSMSKINNSTFWSAIRRLTATMDVIDENPPLDFFSRVKAAASEALDQSAEAAGRAAAALAEKTGQAVSKAAEGFWKEAGLMSFAVAGLAVYWFVS